ncbi:MAG TPA: carbohydrate ABC transporter permease [Gaiellaceae bacterium]|nr:carbohydrate ABC transporter permease [Gaiellaceae bacterium]
MSGSAATAVPQREARLRSESSAVRRRRIGTALTYSVLLAIAVVYIFPFVIAVVTAFKTEPDATANPLSLVPSPATTTAFHQLYKDQDFLVWVKNSAIVTLSVTFLRVFLDSLAGYALARLRFRGRGAAFATIVAVMAVPGVVLLIPKFLMIRQLGMYDTYYGMIVPLLVDAAGVFIMKNFFESIPVSVEESARIDGASIFRIYWSIVLPMARPALVTIFILSFQGSWNELAQFIISAQSTSLNTLTKGVAQLASGQLGVGNRYPLKLAASVLMTIPVAILFFVFQRRIMNASAGAVKE